LAYAACNLPAVFGGSAPLQAGVAGAACLTGLAATAFADFRDAPKPASSEAVAAPTLSFGTQVLMFLALVWLDSAAFYILQNTPALNRFGWSGAVLQWQNAGIHLGAAFVAGWLIDRGGLSRLPFAAVICLGGAAICVSSDREMVARATHWLYAAGVSLYSVALVCAPATECGRDLYRAARRAALLFSVAGWFGSALGIGMAQDLHAIPWWFIGLAAATVVIGSFGRFWLSGPARASIASFVALVAGGATAFHAVAARLRSTPGVNASHEPSAQVGRETYIAEGCIHCHSQYVRPRTADEEWWGPVHSPAEILQQAPPLIGNRRQGPDLLNTGNRRSSAWNRIHLINPRAVSPDSVMPSYAHLFRQGDRRGESLLLYLAELGVDSVGNRLHARAEWSPAAGDSPKPGSLGRDLFERNCAQCHGAGGAGNGPLAPEFGGWQPRNLTLAEWTQTPRHAESRRERVELARVIKFGIIGTPMAGHETWSDQELLATAKYVQSLAQNGAAECAPGIGPRLQIKK
jgi:cytochrome c oxidase cbb3-type subunit 2